MDFVVARMQNSYGFISTGKDKIHGFTIDYNGLIRAMEKQDKNFTFASPMELLLHDHQREWKRTDNIYLNKLKEYHKQESIELAMLMAAELKRCAR